MGSRIIGEGLARAIVNTWFETPFDEGRHRLRIEKIDLVTKTPVEDR
jgi:ribose 5-phosphate isomerase B